MPTTTLASATTNRCWTMSTGSTLDAIQTPLHRSQPRQSPRRVTTQSPNMADDDNDDWLSAAADEAPAGGGGGADSQDDWLTADANADTPAVDTPGEGGGSAADRSGKEWAWPKGVPVLKLPPYRVRRVQPRKLDKFIPFTHWSRPTSLNYDYIYQYRKSYYDDVINYLDCRARGQSREPPRPQTWAERVLRHVPPRAVPERMQITTSTTDDLKNVGKMGGLTHTDALHLFHSNTVIHRKYYDALYAPL